jgi:hypothetical protein
MTEIPPRPIDLEALIRAHPFIRIERPPELWKIDVDDVLFIRFFGELLVALLGRNGGELANVTVQFSNVVIESDAAGPMPEGEFVAVTGLFNADTTPEISRIPNAGSRPSLLSSDLEYAAANAGGAWAYTRSLGGVLGSVTVFFSRRR